MNITEQLAEALQTFVLANNSGDFETLTVRTADITRAREALATFDATQQAGEQALPPLPSIVVEAIQAYGDARADYERSPEHLAKCRETLATALKLARAAQAAQPLQAPAEGEALPDALRVALENLDSMEPLGPTTEAVIDAAQRWYLAAKPQPKVPQPLPVRDEREAFEAWCNRTFVVNKLSRWRDGYEDVKFAYAWEAWQARASITQSAPEAAKGVPADEGPKCRDCADFGPICPNSGLPCGKAATPPAPEAQQAEPLTGCNCRWKGDEQVQWCKLHDAHKEAIHEWAARAKTAEAKLTQPQQPAQGDRFTHEVVPLSEAEKHDLATNFFAEDWLIDKAINLMHDHERVCASAWGVKLAGGGEGV